MNSGSKTVPSFVWQAPDKPFEIHLSLDVVERLAFAVAEGVQALPRRGLEIGGLLLGHMRREASGPVVEIEDYEAVECEHSTGPSYLLTAKDRAALAERIRSLESSGSLQIVGAFRSHTRKEFALAAEDFELMSAYFPAPSDVLLLIHALRDAPLSAGFAVRKDGDLQSPAAVAPFPFRRASLESGGYRLGSVSAAPSASPVAQSDRPVPPRTSEPAPAAPPPEPMPLPALLPLHAAVGQAPPRALVLVIHFPQMPSFAWMRGAIQSKWLTAVCMILLAALAVMWPRSASVPATTGALKASAAPVSSAAAADLKPVPFETSRSVAPPAPDATSESKSSRVEYRARSMDPEELPAPPRKMAPLPAVNLESAARETAPLPEPPVAAPQFAVNTKPAPLLPSLSLPNVPKVAAPFVKLTIEAESPDHGEYFDAPGGKHSDPNDFIPPKLLRDAATEVPESLRAQVKREIPIDVRAYVNKAGKVEFAELTSGARGLKKQLGAIAVFSALRCVFSPATSAAENVPAQVVLRYHFGAQ